MIKQNNNLELNEFQIKRDQSNDTYKFGTELCFTNQRNQNDRVKTGHTVIKSDRKCGRTNLLQLKHVNIGGFSNNCLGVTTPQI